MQHVEICTVPGKRHRTHTRRIQSELKRQSSRLRVYLVISWLLVHRSITDALEFGSCSADPSDDTNMDPLSVSW